jgi:hypothetical protein
MTTTEIIITVGGLILSVLTYFAGAHRANLLHSRADSEIRINRVLDAYLAASRTSRTNGWHGLIQAGVGTLKSDAEIRELLSRIKKHGELFDPGNVIHGIDVFEFFKISAERNFNFMMRGNPEELAAELRSKHA